MDFLSQIRLSGWGGRAQNRVTGVGLLGGLPLPVGRPEGGGAQGGGGQKGFQLELQRRDAAIAHFD